MSNLVMVDFSREHMDRIPKVNFHASGQFPNMYYNQRQRGREREGEQEGREREESERERERERNKE